MEIGIERIDPPDAVFAHEDRGLRIVAEVPPEIGHIVQNFGDDCRMARCRDEKIQSWGREQRLDETPGRCGRPGLTKHPTVCGHAQELVDDTPGQVPNRRAPSPFIYQLAAIRMM